MCYIFTIGFKQEAAITLKHIGIIGYGNIGKRHYKALESLADVSQIHIYSSKDQIPTHKAIFHNNIDSVINESTGIIIAVPNHVHAQYILSLAKENRFVLCEKPLCSKREEINELKKIENPFLINIVFNYRFLKVTEDAVCFIRKYGIQNIKNIKIVFNKNSAFHKQELTWRDSGIGGESSGAFGDLGIHLIDLMIYLCQSHPKENGSRLAIQTRIPKIGGKRVLVDDNASFKGLLENGIHFDILASKSCSPEEKGFVLIIDAQESMFSYHSNESSSILIKENGISHHIALAPSKNMDPENEVFGWADSFVSLHKAWLTKIKGGNNPPILATLQDGITAQEIFFTAYENHHKNRF